MTTPVDYLLQQVANTAPYASTRYPYIGARKHVLELVEYVVTVTDNGKGKAIILAHSLVVSTTGDAHKVGDKVCSVFKLTGHTETWAQNADFARANAFQRAIVGGIISTELTQEELVAAANELRQPTQPGRGIRFAAEGVAKPTKKDPSKSFVDVRYTAIPGQTAASVAANRDAQIKADAVAPAPAPPPPPAPGGLPPPAPGGLLSRLK